MHFFLNPKCPITFYFSYYWNALKVFLPPSTNFYDLLYYFYQFLSPFTNFCYLQPNYYYELFTTFWLVPITSFYWMPCYRHSFSPYHFLTCLPLLLFITPNHKFNMNDSFRIIVKVNIIKIYINKTHIIFKKCNRICINKGCIITKKYSIIKIFKHLIWLQQINQEQILIMIDKHQQLLFLRLIFVKTIFEQRRLFRNSFFTYFLRFIAISDKI